VTAGLGLATAAIGIFTVRWSRPAQAIRDLTVTAGPAGVSAGGRF